MEEAGKFEIRKLQITGGSTFIVSLPKPWVQQNKLGAKDKIRIEWRPNGSLRIIPETVSVRRRIEVDINADEVIDDYLMENLIGAYLSGAQLIRLTKKSPFSKTSRKILRRFINNTRGVEIISETERTVELITMLNPHDMPLFSSINRMYLLISAQMRDINNSLNGKYSIDLEEVNEREKEVDALRLLLERQAGQILVSASMSYTFGTDRWEAAELTNIVRAMERMGDHTYNIACLAAELPAPTNLKSNALPLSAIPIWQNSLKLLMSNIRKLRILDVHDAKANVGSAIKKLSRYEEEILSGEVTNLQDALFLDKLSESIRRLLAYSTDMAESLINIHAYRMNKEVTIHPIIE